MKKITKTQVARLLFFTVAFLTGFQLLIPTMPNIGQHTTTLISAIALYLVSTLTIWRQLISNEIGNGAIKPTIWVAILATIGGLNDIFNVVHFSESVDQWVRFGITLITFAINTFSKLLYPTDDTKSLI